MSTTIRFFFYVMCMLPLYLHINKKSDDFIQKKSDLAGSMMNVLMKSEGPI